MITEHIHREFFNINAWNAVNRKTMHSKRMFRTACTTLWGSVAFRSDMCLSSSNVLWRCSFLCWATEFFFLFEVLLSFDAFFTFFLAVGSILVQSDLISQAKTQQYQCKCIRSFCSNCGSSNVSHTHKKTYKENYYYFFSNFCAMFALVLFQTQKLRREKRNERKKSDEQFFPARVCFSRERPFKIICNGDDFGNSCSKLFMLTNLDSRTRFAAHFIRNGKIIIFHANKCSRCDIQKMRCNVVLSLFWKSANIFAHFVLVLFSPVARFSFSRFFSLCFFLCSSSLSFCAF